MVEQFLVSIAIFNFVPTPSVADTSIGSIYPDSFKSKSAPKPPRESITPGLFVEAANGLIFSTNVLPA